MVDSFPPWTAKIRKDPLGFAAYNQLLSRHRWAESMFMREHVSTDVGGGAGEHNAAEVPREVGSVELSAGPAYTTHNFRHATGATRSALGTCALALDSNLYTDSASMTVQVQNMSENGIGLPCLTAFSITSTAEIKFFHQILDVALGAGNVWAPEDADFCVAIHGAPLGVGLPGTLGDMKSRGSQLSELSTDYNQQVQFDADLRAKFLLDHSAAGLHVNREVARSHAHVQVHAGGAAFDLTSTGTRNPLTVSRVALGNARLPNATAWTLDAQPFVMLDYQRANGGAETDTYVCVTPRSLVTTTTVDVFIYKYDFAAMTWAAADTDFRIVVYAGV